jgi:hypothetical protein
MSPSVSAGAFLSSSMIACCSAVGVEEGVGVGVVDETGAEFAGGNPVSRLRSQTIPATLSPSTIRIATTMRMSLVREFIR